jgi:N-acetylneuraminate synthase
MDLNNYPFLEYIGKQKKPIVLSTGMANLQEIDRAIATIEATKNFKIIILHCVSIYPAPANKINLNRIKSLKSLYPYPVGYSDHSIGDQMSIGAIEDLSNLIKKCKDIYAALGCHRITRTESKKRVEEFRRSIVAARDIKAGEKFTREMLDFKRPGRGLSPEMINIIIGKISKNDISFDSLIKKNDF